jgi:hypothetical protein
MAWTRMTWTIEQGRDEDSSRDGLEEEEEKSVLRLLEERVKEGDR